MKTIIGGLRGALKRMMRRRQAEQRRRSIERIRQHFEGWGCDTRGMTDDEIEAGIKEGIARLNSCALTQEECMDGIFRIQAAMRGVPQNE